MNKVECPEGLTKAYERFLASAGSHQLTRVHLDQGNHRHISFRSVDEDGQRSGFYWYELVTWPGNLVFRGDMGTFVFNRVDDMFKFFRTPACWDLPFPAPNLHYWSEKLVGPTDGRASVQEYQQELLMAEVWEQVEEFIDEHKVDLDNPDEIRQHIGVVVGGDTVVPPLEYGRKGQDFEPYALSPARSRLIATGEPEWAERLRGEVRDDIEIQLCGDRGADLAVLNDFTFYINESDRYAPRKRPDFQFHDAYENESTDYQWQFVWACFAIMQGIRLYDEHKAARRGLRGLPLRWRTRWDWWRQDRAVARRKRRREREMNRKLAAERAAKNKAATTKES